MQASLEGSLRVLFYRTEAGSVQVAPVKLPPRASPKASAPVHSLSVPPSRGARLCLRLCARA